MMLHVVAYGRSLACRCCSNRFARPVTRLFADGTNLKRIAPNEKKGTAGSLGVWESGSLGVWESGSQYY